MRAPPESFKPTTGAPIFIARSMTDDLGALVSESDPPNTVKSCAKRRPPAVDAPTPLPRHDPVARDHWSPIPKSRSDGDELVDFLSCRLEEPSIARRLSLPAS